MSNPNNAALNDTLLALYAATLPAPEPDVSLAGAALSLRDEDRTTLLYAINGILRALAPIGMKEIAAPAALANYIRLFCNTNNQLAYTDEGGTVRVVALKSPVIEALTDAATVTPNCDLNAGGNLLTLSQNTTLANPTGTPVDGQEYILRVKSVSARTWTWGSQYRGGTVALQVATSGSSKTDYLRFRYNAADTKWDQIQLNLNF